MKESLYKAKILEVFSSFLKESWKEFIDEDKNRRDEFYTFIRSKVEKEITEAR